MLLLFSCSYSLTWMRRHHLSLFFWSSLIYNDCNLVCMFREWRNRCFKGTERGTHFESRLVFCWCVFFFSCLLNVWSSFSSSWPKSRELAGAFKAFETVSGKFDHLYSRIRINNQKHLWNPHSRKLRSTKIHGFGFVDVFSFSKLGFSPGSKWSFLWKNSHLLLIVSPITGVIFRFWGSDDPCSLPLDTQGIWKLNPILEIDVVTRVFLCQSIAFK